MTQDVAVYKRYKANCFKIGSFPAGAYKAPIELKNNISDYECFADVIDQATMELIQSESDDLDSSQSKYRSSFFWGGGGVVSAVHI